jgi:hypothetical protein
LQPPPPQILQSQNYTRYQNPAAAASLAAAYNTSTAQHLPPPPLHFFAAAAALQLIYNYNPCCRRCFLSLQPPLSSYLENLNGVVFLDPNPGHHTRIATIPEADEVELPVLANPRPSPDPWSFCVRSP